MGSHAELFLFFLFAFFLAPRYAVKYHFGLRIKDDKFSYSFPKRDRQS
jgi:hypothetical protein